MSDAFERTPPEILTSRLRLRALKRDDSRAVGSYAFDPEVAKFMPWRPQATELFAAGLVDVFMEPQFLNWAITFPEQDAAVGMVFLHSFSRQHHKAEIAFNLSRAHWRKGLAGEAAAAVLAFAFEELGLNRVEALCMPQNEASRRLLERLGMVYEGTMRRVHHRYDGYHDMELFALISSDPAAQGAH
jgi:ribosomal-protein-alanine N-acetyltransferase